MPDGLRQTFLARVEDAGVRQALAERPDLEATLTRLRDEARAAFSDIVVEDDVFAGHLGERVDRDTEAPERLHSRDLYLACACARDDVRALARFDVEYMGVVNATLRRIGVCDSDIDETKQVLRNRFFVSDASSVGRIRAYSGRGPLAGWVRSAATRAALRVLRRAKGEVHVEAEDLAMLPSLDADPELGCMRKEHSVEFVAAFREAFAILPVRDQSLLRQSFRHGLSIDKIGSLHRVHRATAARWLADARSDLAAHIHASLMKRLGVGRATAYSIARLVQGEVSVPELLRTGANEPPRKDS
jgi:RNA polymerase sigma-70 factor, ECF subfamily